MFSKRLSYSIVCILSLFLITFNDHALSQELLLEMKVEGLFGPIADEVAVLGDITEDGINDLLVAGAEGVFIVSGADASKVKHIYTGPETLFLLEGIGDVDDDQVPDFAVSDRESVSVYSTETGERLWTVEGSLGGSMGETLAALGDVSGDGVPDVAAGEPDGDPHGISSAGIVHVLSGDTGAVIRHIYGTRYYERVGDAMDAIPDLDGDGFNDLLIGDSKIYEGSPRYGRVRAVSTSDGSNIFTIQDSSPDTGFGSGVWSTPDIDGNGKDDFAVGSFNTSYERLALYSGETQLPLWSEPIGIPGRLASVDDMNNDNVPDLVAARFAFIPLYQGEMDLIDGATGAIIDSFVSGLSGFSSIASPGDLNNDGKPELLTALFGTNGAQDPYAVMYSLPDVSTLYTITNPSGGDYLGSQVGVAGDIDGDGLDDYILSSLSRLMVYAGDGSGPIFDENVQLPMAGASSVAGFVDLTGDNVPEMIFSNGNWSGATNFMGRLLIVSGADGSVVDDIEGAYGGQHFGVEVAPTIDRNNDGVRDFYVSVSGETLEGQKYAGEVRLLSGATRETLQVYRTTPQQYGSFGLSLSAGGDVDEDGVPDLGVGSSMDAVYPYTTGAFYVVSGATGEELYRIDGYPGSYSMYGDILGDASGDGVADFISNEPFWRHPDDPNDSDRGRVRVWSGKDGSLLWQVEGSDIDDRFGWPAKSAGDVNGDGYVDVAVSARNGGAEGTGEFLLLSGLDGSVLDSLDLPTYATSLATVGSFDAGASADVIVGLPFLDNNGGAHIYAGSQGGVHGFQDLGFALKGTAPAAPQLKGYGGLAAGEQASLKVRRVLPNTLGYWFFSFDAAYLPFKGGIFVPDPYGVLFSFPVFSNMDGEFTFTGINPPDIPSGAQLVHQFWFYDGGAPFGASATNGLSEVFK